MYLTLFVGVLCWSLFLVHIPLCRFYFSNHLDEEKRAGYFAFGCIVTVNVLQLFLKGPWVGLQFVIVVFPDHTHLLFVC